MSTLSLPPHASVGHVAPRSPGRAAIVGILTVGLLVAPLLLTALVVPKFEDIFKDFGVALTPLTRGFLQIGRWLTSPVGVVLVGAWVVGAITLVVLLSWRSRLAAMLLLIAGVVFSGLYLFALLISMFLPMVAMTESLQQGGAV